MKKVLIFGIKVYQWTLSLLIGNQCRFWPSCSQYAIIQLHTRSIPHAALKIVWRILRCNPWAKGGFDLD